MQGHLFTNKSLRQAHGGNLDGQEIELLIRKTNYQKNIGYSHVRDDYYFYFYNLGKEMWTKQCKYG